MCFVEAGNSQNNTAGNQLKRAIGLPVARFSVFDFCNRILFAPCLGFSDRRQNSQRDRNEIRTEIATPRNEIAPGSQRNRTEISSAAPRSSLKGRTLVRCAWQGFKGFLRAIAPGKLAKNRDR